MSYYIISNIYNSMEKKCYNENIILLLKIYFWLTWSFDSKVNVILGLYQPKKKRQHHQ